MAEPRDLGSTQPSRPSRVDIEISIKTARYRAVLDDINDPAVAYVQLVSSGAAHKLLTDALPAHGETVARHISEWCVLGAPGATNPLVVTRDGAGKVLATWPLKLAGAALAVAAISPQVLPPSRNPHTL